MGSEYLAGRNDAEHAVATRIFVPLAADTECADCGCGVDAIVMKAFEEAEISIFVAIGCAVDGIAEGR